MLRDMLKGTIKGIHHITGAVVNGQRDYDFYTKVMGLRMVKRTVNHEVGNLWHFFYGDYEGHDGTIMTNMLFDGMPLGEYKRGRGSIDALAYSIPVGSTDFWVNRLGDAGMETTSRPDRFGNRVTHFQDPGGLDSELIECDDDPRQTTPYAGLDASNIIRGFHSATLIPRIPELTLEYFTDGLGFEVIGREGNRTRLGTSGGGPGKTIDLLDEPDLPWGEFGIGAIHHIAFTCANMNDMRRVWGVLGGSGMILTDMRDRKWFHSAYMTEPGGINIEFSNLDPGFTVDEPLEELGAKLQLPKQWEKDRERIEKELPAMVW